MGFPGLPIWVSSITIDKTRDVTIDETEVYQNEPCSLTKP